MSVFHGDFHFSCTLVGSLVSVFKWSGMSWLSLILHWQTLCHKMKSIVKKYNSISLARFEMSSVSLLTHPTNTLLMWCSSDVFGEKNYFRHTSFGNESLSNNKSSYLFLPIGKHPGFSHFDRAHVIVSYGFNGICFQPLKELRNLSQKQNGFEWN